MAQKYQQIKINKVEFKNLVIRKIDNVHEFSRNKLQLLSQIRPSKTTNCE